MTHILHSHAPFELCQDVFVLETCACGETLITVTFPVWIGFKEVKEGEERGEKASQEIKKNKGCRPKNKKNDKKPKKAKKEDDDEEQKEVAHKKEVLKEGKKAAPGFL